MAYFPVWTVWPVAVLALIVAAVALLRRNLAVVRVCGPSMMPTLRSGDRVVVRRVPARRLRAGDIVVFRVTELATRATDPRPRYRRQWVIKRVAAVPGEPLPAPVAAVCGAMVPDRTIVVLGDNAPRSIDSRQTGPVRWDDVYGIVWRRLSLPASR